MNATAESVAVSTSPLVSIVIPTYREAENLPVIVPRIAEVLEQAGIAGEIVIVDDNSQDGTEEVCAELARDYPLRLEIRTEERGLSSAVIHGMRLAEGDILLVMDADLSHPPEKIPELVQQLGDSETAFVIGSRYVEGGGTAGDWGLFRWLNSKVATWLARPFTSARDPMAGFFALRRTTFEQAESLNPVGYKIGLELIVKCGCRHVREVPIFFADRLHGESKLSLREQMNYLRHLARLAEYKLRSLPRLPKFLFVGGTGSGIDLLSFWLCMLLLPVPIARAVAIWIAMSWNFNWNRRWTFCDAEQASPVKQYFLFCGACLIGAVISWGTSIGLWRFVPFFAAHPILAAGIGVVAGVAFNFAVSSSVVFPKKTAVQVKPQGRA